MIRKKMKWLIGPMLAGAVLLTPGVKAEPAVNPGKIEQLAKNASTAAEHSEVARQYRLRAESLEAKALLHEEEAGKLAKRPLPGLAHKWPAMVARPAEQERRLALQARRAARESYELADRHLRRAVEAGFVQTASK
jgi:hypothetical protein